jgi:GTP-binding protein
VRILSVRHEKSALSPEDFPLPTLPEVAFVGRSNVGKSSLINCLVNRRGLAEVSKSPGKTRRIHFFNVNERLRLVDLPGYGYAEVPVQVRRGWKPLVEAYLAHRPALASVVWMTDIRREIEDDERAFIEWMDRSLTADIIAVLTKADKVPFGRAGQKAASVARLLRGRRPPVVFSARTGMGKAALWSRIGEAVSRHRS